MCAALVALCAASCKPMDGPDGGDLAMADLGRVDAAASDVGTGDLATADLATADLATGDGGIPGLTLAFAPGVAYDVGAPARYVVLSDLNADQKLDIAVAAGDGASVLLGKGDGTFGKAVAYPGGDTGAMALAAADLDRDNKVDLVLTLSAKTGRAGFLYGNGDGTFIAPSNYDYSNPSNWVGAGDLNHDGLLDLVLLPAPCNAGFLYTQLNRGLRVFGKPAGAITDCPQTAVFTDFDRDGVIDLVVGSGVDGFRVMPGVGDGTFKQDFYSGVMVPFASVFVRDVDGDGILDVVGSGGTSIGFGNGGVKPMIPLPGGGVPWMDFADLDRDGKHDLVGAAGASFKVWRGLGQGLFDLPKSFAAVNADRVAAGDLNGDGKIDLVTVGGTGVVVYLNSSQ
jgi:FG-GAP-like repeat